METTAPATLFDLTPAQRETLVARLRERRERAAADASPVVRLAGAGGSRTPFFCVHAIGGAVFSYVELAQALGPDQPFYGLQARGLDGRSAPFTEISEMAAAYVRAVRTVQPQGPYRLGGWSFGGTVAVEMARQLRAAGERVELLALLDSWSPRLCGASAPVDAEVETLLAHDLGPAADALSPQQRECLFAVYRAHLEALYRYRPEPWLDESLFVTLMRTKPAAGLPEAPANGWEEILLGDIEVCPVPGDHYSLLTKPQVQVLAERLATRLGA